MTAVPVYYGWLCGGELPCFNALRADGEAVPFKEADLYHPRLVHGGRGEKVGWHREKGSGNCGLLAMPLGGPIAKGSVSRYVNHAAQALSPRGGSFLVMLREVGEGEMAVGVAHTDYDGPVEEPSGTEADMGLASEVVLEEPGCPGKGRCHGPMQWCDECGDVDFTCDFPDCDVHPRLAELERELAYLREETARLARDWRYSEIETARMQESVDRARRAAKGGQVMVPRPDP